MSKPTENSEWIFAIGKTNYDGSHQSKPIRELVRCKDCKHYCNSMMRHGDEPIKMCDIGKGGTRVKADWFCADGERRDDEKVD